jgi:hypothetical protein
MAGAIRYQLVGTEELQEALALFNNHFLAGEPMTKSFNRNVQSPGIDSMMLSMLKEGMSWCAIDEMTGEMVGVFITSEDSLASLPDAPLTYEQYLEMGISKEWCSVFLLFDAVLDIKKVMLEHNETKSFKLFALGIHCDHRNRGIGAELAKCTISHAMKLGYTFADAICSNRYTQKLCERLGFEKVNEIIYATYLDPPTNTYLFKNVEEPHKSAISYVKKI